MYWVRTPPLAPSAYSCASRRYLPTWSDAGPGQRRGPKGHFQNARLEFLEGQVPAYLATKKGGRQKFWHDLYCGWWQRFPWKLSDDEEPPTNDPEEMARLASVAPGDADLKAQVEKRLNDVRWANLFSIAHQLIELYIRSQRLTGWFANHGNPGSRRGHATWLPLLQRLHQIRNPRPRRRTAAQQFMLDYSDVFNAAFVKYHGSGERLGGAQCMNLRAQLAKKMVSSSQYSHLTNELERKAAEHHEKEMNEWNLILDDISEAVDVSACVVSFLIPRRGLLTFLFCSACDALFDAVHPLLSAIGSYANCHVSLIVGDPGKDESDDGFFTAYVRPPSVMPIHC
jgi:hypothetical protein